MPNDVFLPFAPAKPWLAPLAGWSDLPFRLLCRRFGAAVCCTEMISAKGLIYKSPGTAELFATCPEDGPVVVQLFGSEAPFMEAAAGQLRDKGFVWFDCNMGCSVPKVARTGSGAAMCKDIDNALSVAEALIRAAGRGRVGFKLRLGWDEPGRSPAAETWRVLAPALEALGAGWLTLHPRTAKQGFTGTARWEYLSELKALVSYPSSPAGTCSRRRTCTLPRRNGRGYRHVRARGLADPAIFKAHLDLLAGREPEVADVATLLARIREHARLARELSTEKVALLKMRTIVPRYVRHIEGSKQLRADIIACRSWDDFEKALRSFEAGKSSSE
ncbi:MAG: tRNA dihydrouridine synthase [Bilophila wadsworthia]